MLNFLKKLICRKEEAPIPKPAPVDAAELGRMLNALRKNEISITLSKAAADGEVTRSKFGGRPAVPAGFVWPRFESENFDGERENRPLSFLCQINLREIHALDKETLLPDHGLLLFFYEQESMKWGFDPEDEGCSRVFWFEDETALAPAENPEDLKEQYRVKEYDLTFGSEDSYPDYEELHCHVRTDCDWGTYADTVEAIGCEFECERHKLLGYADLIQSEMLTECERVTRGLYCGNAESYENTPADVKADISRSAPDWILLFQMASIMEEDYEFMIGDLGNLYFYIRKEDLKARNFDKVWLIAQCG